MATAPLSALSMLGSARPDVHGTSRPSRGATASGYACSPPQHSSPQLKCCAAQVCGTAALWCNVEQERQECALCAVRQADTPMQGC